jgi:hypothetical protein
MARVFDLPPSHRERSGESLHLRATSKVHRSFASLRMTGGDTTADSTSNGTFSFYIFVNLRALLGLRFLLLATEVRRIVRITAALVLRGLRIGTQGSRHGRSLPVFI